MAFASKHFSESKISEYPIVMDSKTFQESSKFFSFNTLTPIHVKGKTDLIDVYQPTSEKKKDESHVPSAHHFHSVSVFGREIELKQLEDLYVEFQQSSKGGIVVIEADAGFGKCKILFSLTLTVLFLHLLPFSCFDKTLCSCCQL
jgi:hypothetical protein